MFSAETVSAARIQVMWTARYSYMGFYDWIDWGGILSLRGPTFESFTNLVGQMRDTNFDPVDQWTVVSASRYYEYTPDRKWDWEVDGWANQPGSAVVRGRVDFLDENDISRFEISNEVLPL